MRSGWVKPLERFVWISLLLIMSGGTAYALGGSNTVFSDDIVNGEVRSADVANDTTPYALTGRDVASNSLTGADIDESTLGQVPSAVSAAVGGIGRSSALAGCNPSDESLLTCTTVSMTLPAPSRVLLIGRVRAITDDGQTVGFGSCNLGTNFSGTITGSTVEIATTQNDLEQVPLMAVTPLIGADNVMFGINCNQENTHGGGIRYDFISLDAVALSSG